MELTTALLALVILLIGFFWRRRNSRHLPPCPTLRLPVLGHLLFIGRDARPTFKKWREKCGDMYSLYMGGTLVLVLNGYDLIKEALVKQADYFSDRPPFFIDMTVGMSDKGVLFSSGANWKEQRSIGLSILRVFGMGKNLLADKIQEEVGFYVDYLASLKGKPSNLRVMTNISTSNIICSVLIGHRFEYSDMEFRELMHKLNDIVRDNQTVSLVNFYFWLRHFPGDIFKAKRLATNMKAIMNMLQKFIKEKRRQVDDSEDVCNLIDAYLIERNKKLQAGVSTNLDDQNLLKIMMDLFGAGTETTSTTIYWCLLFILNHPEVQEKIFQEIKDNVGTDRAPCIQDRSQLIYLNAVIMETQRLASIVPLSVTHMCSEDVALRGYTIPKGTYILPNLDSVLHEQATWGVDAMSFRPDRFIDGNYKLKVPEEFVPFSLGRRVCLGEALARMELFLFLASMFQRFQFLPPTPGCVPPLEYECGIVISPKPYEIRAVERCAERGGSM